MSSSARDLFLQVRRLAVLSSLPVQPTLAKRAGVGDVALRIAKAPIKYVARGKGANGVAGRALGVSVVPGDVASEGSKAKSRSAEIAQALQQGRQASPSAFKTGPDIIPGFLKKRRPTVRAPKSPAGMPQAPGGGFHQ